MGLGHNVSRDSVEKVVLPKSIGRNSTVKVRNVIPDSENRPTTEKARIPKLQGWASNFGRSLLDLDIFRDRVVLEYLTIEYPTRNFADALDRSSFTRFHLIFRVKWKSRVKLDFTRFYSTDLTFCLLVCSPWTSSPRSAGARSAS